MIATVQYFIQWQCHVFGFMFALSLMGTVKSFHSSALIISVSSDGETELI